MLPLPLVLGSPAVQLQETPPTGGSEPPRLSNRTSGERSKPSGIGPCVEKTGFWQHRGGGGRVGVAGTSVPSLGLGIDRAPLRERVVTAWASREGLEGGEDASCKLVRHSNQTGLCLVAGVARAAFSPCHMTLTPNERTNAGDLGCVN